MEREGYKLKFLIEFRDELCGARESHKRDTYETPIHAPVLSYAFSEWPALVVNGKGRYLLDELEQIDCAIEKRRLKLPFEVHILLARLNLLDIIRKVDERDDVDGKLTQY